MLRTKLVPVPVPGLGAAASDAAGAPRPLIGLGAAMALSPRGAVAQSWLTALEVGGLLLIVFAALVLMGQGGAPAAAVGAVGAAADAPGIPASIGLAMVFVLLTYGGWNEAAYLSAELM